MLLALKIQKNNFNNYILSIPEISRYHSCLEVDQQSRIQDCKTNQLQEKSLCVKFDVSTDNKATDQNCRNQDYEIGRILYESCTNTKRNGYCVYNLTNILMTGKKLVPPSKKISIVYSCKGKVRFHHTRVNT